jgi:hypothetical protein
MEEHGDHYFVNDIEAIDGIKAALGEEGFKSYCLGNAIKYIWRQKHKGEQQKDLSKAVWYTRMAYGDDPRDDRKPIEIDPVANYKREPDEQRT